MFEKILWFGLGYFTARYLILKYGIEVYSQKEKEIVGIGRQELIELKDELFDETETDNSAYSSYLEY